MQTLFKRKKININVSTPKVKRSINMSKNSVVRTIWMIVRVLIISLVCAGVYYKVGNLYALSLAFFFTFLVLFFAPEEIFIVTSLLTVICAVLYLIGYNLYYIKVGEFIFVSIGAGIIRMSGVLFEREKKKVVVSLEN